MELGGPSVELLLVLSDALRLMSATGTIVGAVKLVFLDVTSMSLAITMLPELRWLESPSLPT